jgi:hypothetical protein
MSGLRSPAITLMRRQPTWRGGEVLGSRQIVATEVALDAMLLTVVFANDEHPSHG